MMVTLSVITKSKLEGTQRIDAEYYQPQYLENDKVIKNYRNGFRLLREVLKKSNAITGGATPLGADYLEFGIPFLRVQNVMQNYLDLEDVVYIKEDIHNGLLRRSKIKAGDVLLTITGVSYGKSATIPTDFKEGNINQHSVKIEVDNNIILPEFLSTFFNSKFGKYQNDRKITGLSRPGLVYTELKNILIPLVSLDKQRQIKETVVEANETLKKSESFYSQAEDLLLQELGLNDFKFEENLAYNVNLSEIKLANRMDAEYFQPKYDAVVARIKKHNLKPLSELVTMKKGFEPGSDEYQEEGKAFLRVSNISKFGFTDKEQKYLSNELYQELKSRFEPKTGDILLTKDATPGIAYVLKDPFEVIIASGIMRLKIKEDIDTEYLSLCINSLVCQMQVERDAGGSIIVHWKPEQIKNLLIPILPKSTQQKIADLVRKSHEARKKAKELLEEAKKEVERIIEKAIL